jgi:hypothetical protein
MNNHPSFQTVDPFQMVRSMAERAIVFDGWSILNESDVVHAAPCVYMGLSHVRSSVNADDETA